MESSCFGLLLNPYKTILHSEIKADIPGYFFSPELNNRESLYDCGPGKLLKVRTPGKKFPACTLMPNFASILFTDWDIQVENRP